MTKNQRYPEEFKIKAVKQIANRGCEVAGVSTRLVMSWDSPYSTPPFEG